MDTTCQFPTSIDLPTRDAHDLPASEQRFPDGGQYRIEIPSVEGPAALRMVYEAADAFSVPVHRVSQGSGVMLLTDDELDEMAALAADHGIEVSLLSDRVPGGTPGRWPTVPLGGSSRRKCEGWIRWCRRSRMCGAPASTASRASS